MRFFSWLLICLALAACSSTPSRQVMGKRDITPAQAVKQFDRLKTEVLEWGGVIVESRNLEETTEIQIIAYPLQKSGRPDLDKAPISRFIAVSPGYLETADYSKGRSITLSGTLLGIRDGKVGDADYRFPLIKPNEMQLWPVETSTETDPRVRFGIGVGTGVRTHGSIGIGIGF
jgi:outer membrane lipoprotein